MNEGLAKRMSQTSKEFRLWEGKVFNTKMEKNTSSSPVLLLLQSGDHHLVITKGDCED